RLVRDADLDRRVRARRVDRRRLPILARRWPDPRPGPRGVAGDHTLWLPRAALRPPPGGVTVTQRYVLGLDQGATSSRAMLFGRDGRVVSVAQREFPQIFPKPGEVEHDPEAIWTSQLESAREAIRQTG